MRRSTFSAKHTATGTTGATTGGRGLAKRLHLLANLLVDREELAHAATYGQLGHPTRSHTHRSTHTLSPLFRSGSA